MTTTNENFVNIHALISHNCSLLNRDETGAHKKAMFGGVTRMRHSSQSQKRAMRKSEYYSKNIGSPSFRTIRLSKLAEYILSQNKDNLEEDTLIKTLQIMSGLLPVSAKSTDKGDGKTGKSSTGAKQKKKNSDEEVDNSINAAAMSAWSLGEILKSYEIVAAETAEGANDNAIAKKLKKESENFKQYLKDAVDIALAGRMITAGTLPSIDGSMSLAHAITTHASDSDIDWFTATDDMKAEFDEKGSSHINSQEFSSGVFYRYCSLNIRQLQENLGGASREEALKIAGDLAYMLATVVPDAKQNSFAAFNMADLVMVSFSDAPCSLANAFETPVKSTDGFMKPSCDALVKYWDKVSDAYGLAGKTMMFTTQDEIESGTTVAKMSDLVSWTRQDGQLA